MALHRWILVCLALVTALAVPLASGVTVAGDVFVPESAVSHGLGEHAAPLAQGEGYGDDCCVDSAPMAAPQDCHSAQSPACGDDYQGVCTVECGGYCASPLFISAPSTSPLAYARPAPANPFLIDPALSPVGSGPYRPPRTSA